MYLKGSDYSGEQKDEPSTPRWWGVTKLVSSTILSGERKQQESKQATLESVSQFSTARFIEANVSFKEHNHDHSGKHPQFCTRHPAVVSCPRPILHESALRPLGLPRCQHVCSGHPWAPLKRDDAVRREVAR